MTTTSKIHPFEKAGLGIAPFRCVGMDRRVYQAIPGDPNCPIQPGGCCAYCAQGIMDCFSIKSSDGKVFIVGSDCVAKCERECAGTDAEKASRKLHDDMLRVKRVATHKSQDSKIAKITERLADESVRAKLAALPHGIAWRAEQGATKLDELEWLLKNGGRAGKLRVGKAIDAALAV